MKTPALHSRAHLDTATKLAAATPLASESSDEQHSTTCNLQPSTCNASLGKYTPSRSEHGSALLIALVFGAVVAIVLASYLGLVQSRNLARARAFAWNAAIPVMEAGIEEAFTHLEDDSTLTANAWTSIGTNSTIIYQKTRTNSDSSYYVVTLSNVASSPITAPVIYSRGFVPAPLGKGYISRYVQVCALQPVTFSKAIASKGTVTLSGSATVDSFNSGNTNYST